MGTDLLVDERVVAQPHAILVCTALLGLEILVCRQRHLRATQLAAQLLLHNRVLAGRVLGVGLQLLLQPLHLLPHLPRSLIARMQPRTQIVEPRVRLGLPLQCGDLPLRELQG